MPGQAFYSFADVLRWRAEREPDRRAYAFLQDGDIESASLTYGELDRLARAIAAALQARPSPAERALLLYPQGLEFVTALWGCLYAGVAAVPIPPPRPGQSLSRLLSVARDARATTALTPTASQWAVAARQDAADLPEMDWLPTGEVPDELGAAWRPPVTRHEDIAILQYTSGSTGAPKGVMVSHSNLLHNSEYLQRCFEHTPDSVSVTWLPSFHDMGLIDGVLQPVYGGFSGVLMPPGAFLQSPVRWLRAITRYRATHSGCPNFGYELCVRKVSMEQRDDLDLSSWVSAYNGAEPVQSATLERFAEYFRTAGFRSHYFYPCYGMAEATLIITGGQLQDEPVVFNADAVALEDHRVVPVGEDGERVRPVVGCGRPWLSTRVEIVDPETRRRCSPEEVGEIWTRGPSVAQGYWRRPSETRETFGAFIEGGDEGPFLRTGDLGFMRDGELFVTGRIKDMIIIRGLNFYPQDIEQTAQASYPGLRPSGCAAFSIDAEDGERLVVVQEVERVHLRRFDTPVATRAVQKAIVDEFGIQAHAIVFIRPATLPKTSSGKIQRRACRERFLAQTLAVLSLQDSAA